jgi:hypothetical protein
MRHVANLPLCEKDDYSMTLARQQGSALEELHLYGVVVMAPTKTETVFVLAESEEGAASQALCAVSLESHRLPPEVSKLISTHVERIPLIIRGWSRNQF